MNNEKNEIAKLDWEMMWKSLKSQAKRFEIHHQDEHIVYEIREFGVVVILSPS